MGLSSSGNGFPRSHHGGEKSRSRRRYGEAGSGHILSDQDAAAALKRFRAGELDIAIAVRRPTKWRCCARRCRARSRSRLLSRTIICPSIWRANRSTHQGAPGTDHGGRPRDPDGEGDARRPNSRLQFGAPGMPRYSYAAQARWRGLPMAAKLEKAKSLLAAAGFGPSTPLSFDFLTYNSTEPS